MSEIYSTESGFPSEIFLQPPSDNDKCSLCLQVMRDPRGCAAGHLFCKGCIEKSIYIKPECPLCRSPLTREALVCNLYAKNHIGSMDIKCITTREIKNDESCCGWIGKIDSLDNHLEKDCNFFRVKCPYAGMGCSESCPQYIFRRELDDHIQDSRIQSAVIQSLIRRVNEDANELAVLRAKAKSDSLTIQYLFLTFQWQENKLNMQHVIPTNNLPEYFEDNSTVTSWFGRPTAGPEFMLFLRSGLDIEVHAPPVVLANLRYIAWSFKNSDILDESKVFEYNSPEIILMPSVTAKIYLARLHPNNDLVLYLYLRGFRGNTLLSFCLHNFENNRSKYAVYPHNWTNEERFASFKFVTLNDFGHRNGLVSSDGEVNIMIVIKPLPPMAIR